MTTKQTGTVAMTKRQLETMVGGAYELKNVQVTSCAPTKRRANRITATTTGRVAGYGEAATDTSGGT